MKAILAACVLVLAGLLAWFFLSGDWKDRHGNPFQGYPSVSIRELAEKPAEHLKKNLRIEGTVGRQCPSAGCWFYLQGESGKEVKVEMGDTTPRLTQRTGKMAMVEGQWIQYGDAFLFIGTAVEFR